MLKNIFLVLLGMMLAFTAISCKKSCGVNCLNGGTCNGNSCNCPDPYSGYNCDTMCVLGYEGYMCHTLSREKFLGTWSCTSTDQSGNSKTYLITFSPNSYQLYMNLNNFNNNSADTIVCALTGKDVFSINQTEQDSLATALGISGSGQLQNGKITLNISENGGLSFFATATPQ